LVHDDDADEDDLLTRRMPRKIGRVTVIDYVAVQEASKVSHALLLLCLDYFCRADMEKNKSIIHCQLAHQCMLKFYSFLLT
jgi:hypothetical protein